MLNFIKDLKDMYWYEYLIIACSLIVGGFLVGLGLKLAFILF